MTEGWHYIWRCTPSSSASTACETKRLVDYIRLVSEATRVPIPFNYPVAGSDAFRTATGIHAAAIVKAQKRGDLFLAERVYSGVPPSDFGREQKIEIGHMSGISNVEHWLARHGMEPDPEITQAILKAAKHSPTVLTDDEILAAADSARRPGSCPVPPS
jgi:isopropylmalate/homocitrate/citramalate synthase